MMQTKLNSYASILYSQVSFFEETKSQLLLNTVNLFLMFD